MKMIAHRIAAAISTQRSALFVLAVCSIIGGALGRASADDDETSFIGVVTGDKVFVRSGPADSYYPIGRVNTGDLVKVTSERFGWARVLTIGPTFHREEFFGYIIYPKTQPGRFRLSDDGTTGRTLGRADVLAPNLNTEFNPNDSWKPLIRLDADTTVRVIETLESANNIVQKIALPKEAEVWISMRYIDRANESQLARWERHFQPEEAREEASGEEPPATSAPEPDAERPADSIEPTEPDQPLAREEQPVPEVEPMERADVPAEDESTHDAQETRDDSAAQPDHDGEQSPEADRAGDRKPVSETRESQDDADRDTDALDDDAADATAESEDVSTGSPDSQTDDSANNDDETAEEDDAAGDDDEPTTAARLAEATLDDLEVAFEQLREESIETAEVAPLRRMYLDFAERADNDRERRFAKQRAEQLALWAEIQEKRQQLARMKSRAEVTGERAAAARRAVDDAGDYTVVGRLAVSTIYDGRRLPMLLRLQEPGTGRTVAYVEPDADYDMTSMIGQLIGVIGEKEYDGGLRLNLIRPRRVDILAPQQ